MLCTESEYKLNGYKMRKINALFFIFALFATPAAYAWDASEFADAWGADVSSGWTCKSHDPQDSIIGNGTYVNNVFTPTCTGNGGDKDNDKCGFNNNGRWTQGVMMLVARKINANGAYFCPTGVFSTRSKWQKVLKNKYPMYTLYYQKPGQSAADCFWLCKPGWAGDGCSIAAEDYSSCDPTTVKRSNYDGKTDENGKAKESFAVTTATKDVENDIPMFATYGDDPCKPYGSCDWVNCPPDENDIILAVSHWLPSGHGAIVQPFLVRTGYDRWYQGPGWPIISANGMETLVCKSGYEPNFTNDDCVAVNPDICDVVVAADGDNACGDKYGEFYDLDDFNAETMELHFFGSEPAYSSSGKHVLTAHYNCWGILCTTPGYGFDPNVSRATCVDCGVSDLRNGVNWFGKCVRCDVGEIFDSTTGSCVTATALSHDRLYYGPGKDENTAIIEQCWTEPDTRSYSDCVWGNSESTGKLIRAVGTSIRLLSLPNGGNGGGSGGNGGDNDNDSGGTGGGSNGLVVGDVMVPGPSGGGSGGGSGIKTMETGLVSNPQMY